MDKTTEAGRSTRLSLTELRLPMWICELVGSGVLIWVFVDYLLQARALRQSLNPLDMGPGGFPMLLASVALIALVLLVCVILVKRLRGAQMASLTIPRPLSVLATMGLMVAMTFAFDHIGALVTVYIFAAAILLACGERRPLHVVGVPILLTAFIYVVFALALGVRLP